MSGGYVLGIDYGTDSARALLVSLADGAEVSCAQSNYPRWSEGKFCDAGKNMFRQHPLDYLECLEEIVRECLAAAPAGAADQVMALSIGTTGSTPVAVDRDGRPLALLAEFADNPNAMFVLWKDHTAIEEAQRINDYAKGWGGVDYTLYSGGTYSSEWFWAKILHIISEDEAIREAAFSWVEHCDWLPALLTGNNDVLTIKRSRCAAGHKAMWHESWGGLPDEEFLSGLDPLLARMREKLYTETYTTDTSAGGLCRDWADRLGLKPDTPVSVGAIDAHMGAVGAKIGSGVITKVIGTSTCDMGVFKNDNLISGICGQVDGSIIPGYTGLEAGQSAFGDLYSWYSQLLNWPVKAVLAGDDNFSQEEKSKIISLIKDQTLKTLNIAAAEIELEEDLPIALDWINGRRTPDADQRLKLAIAGLSMGSDAPGLFRSLVEATAFGNRKIIEHLQNSGVEVREIVAIGGISKKAPFVMQVCADVLGMPISVAKSEQCCALGAAIFAAVICGRYETTEQAQAGLGSDIEMTYTPDMKKHEIYTKRYGQYLELGEFEQKRSAAAI